MSDFDLCVIGSGSGNSLLDERFADRRVALVEQGTFGGTCLNVGCIPTKMFVLPGDLAVSPIDAARLGVSLSFDGVDWPAVRDRIFGRIDPISRGGEQWRTDNDNVTLFRDHARFTAPGRLAVGTGNRTEEITADAFVIAAGSRALWPQIPGMPELRANGLAHTSDTVMRLERLPASMVIIGGGFVAAEFAHIFGAFGTRVSLLQRSAVLLRAEDEEIARAFTEALGQRLDVALNITVERVESGGEGVVVHTRCAGQAEKISAEVLLVATGRRPNGDLLNVTAGGFELDAEGRVVVDDFQRTGVAGSYALGDVSSAYQLKHVANHEMRVVRHNLLHPDILIRSDHRYVPHAVFSHPQIAAVGLTEAQARERGLDYASVRQGYGDVAYGWALEDTESFCKLLADRATGRLIGAHLIGPQASSLIQPLIAAMSFEQPVAGLARGQYWIHPALPEVVENALLALEAELGG